MLAKLVNNFCAWRPTKNTKKFQLQALRKPVFYKPLAENANDQLPTDIQRLYNRIDQITVERVAFLPWSVRHEICTARGRKLGDSWFTTPQRTDNREKALLELRRLQHIVSKARQCQELGRSEASWNAKVHEPLLELAFEPFEGTVESEPAPDARILSAFLPLTESQSTTIESKIDFAVVLDPTITDEDRSLAQSIRRTVFAQDVREQSVNQTGYQPLLFRPAATFIETKTTGSADEGRTQLAIFTAALHQRLAVFLDAKFDIRKPQIITLPQILTLEHDWKLFFGCDRGDHIDMVGDMSVGDTKNLVGAYTLLAVMREIARFVVEDYKKVD